MSDTFYDFANRHDAKVNDCEPTNILSREFANLSLHPCRLLIRRLGWPPWAKYSSKDSPSTFLFSRQYFVGNDFSWYDVVTLHSSTIVFSRTYCMYWRLDWVWTRFTLLCLAFVAKGREGGVFILQEGSGFPSISGYCLPTELRYLIRLHFVQKISRHGVYDRYAIRLFPTEEERAGSFGLVWVSFASSRGTDFLGRGQKQECQTQPGCTINAVPFESDLSPVNGLRPCKVSPRLVTAGVQPPNRPQSLTAMHGVVEHNHDARSALYRTTRPFSTEARVRALMQPGLRMH